MSVVRAVALVGLAHLTGCFVMPLPPSVPKVERPTLAADAVVEFQTGRANESRSYTEKSDVCSKGGGNCVEVRTKKHKNVRVTVASASVDGNPLSIGQVAAAASPEFMTDTEKLRGLTSSCRRGRIAMMGGGLALTAAYLLLNAGFGEPRNTPAVIGGFAAIGTGVTVISLGRFAFGGQHCGEAKQLYKKWSPVYEDPDATTVKSDSAEMLEQLVEKFNRDHKGAQAQSAPDEPSPEE